MEDQVLLTTGIATNLKKSTNSKGLINIYPSKFFGPQKTLGAKNFLSKRTNNKFNTKIAKEQLKNSVLIQDSILTVEDVLEEYGKNPVATFNPLELKEIELEQISYQVLTDNGMHWVGRNKTQGHDVVVFKDNKKVHQFETPSTVLKMWAY